MDPSFIEIFKQLSGFGAAGLIAAIWYLDRRDFGKIMAQYASDMQEQRDMYNNNVLLVKEITRISLDLHNVVVFNTQIMQRMVDAINANQFCPMVRVESKKPGV